MAQKITKTRQGYRVHDADESPRRGKLTHSKESAEQSARDRQIALNIYAKRHSFLYRCPKCDYEWRDCDGIASPSCLNCHYQDDYAVLAANPTPSEIEQLAQIHKPARS